VTTKPPRLSHDCLKLTFILLLAALPAVPTAAAQRPQPQRLSEHVRRQSVLRGKAPMDVIVRFRRQPGRNEQSLVQRFGGQTRRRLGS